MVRIGLMTRANLRLDRRELMTGFGAAWLGMLLPAESQAQGRPTVTIQARRGALNLRPGGPETPVWMLEAPELRFRRGDVLAGSIEPPELVAHTKPTAYVEMGKASKKLGPDGKPLQPEYTAEKILA